MLNHRFITEWKGAESFVEGAVEFIRKHAEGRKVFCALSGGIDSAATYLLLKKSGIDTVPVFIDHGLMRIIRGKEEREHIKKLFPDVRVVDIRSTFLPQIYAAGEDAENKRKLFKKAYSDTISRVIKEERCQLLADGTILPDIEESFGVKIGDVKESMTTADEAKLLEKNKARFVKSQHNLSIEYEVEATVQPVASLIKDQVRAVLEFFEMPVDLVYRKAFPGPALSARIIGPVTEANLAMEKQVHDIVESTVDDHYMKEHKKPLIINAAGEQEPFQAFAAISDDVTTKKVTGLVNGARTYELPAIERGELDLDALIGKATKLKGRARLFFEMAARDEGIYDVVIRSVNSKDARTASVTRLPLPVLGELKDAMLQIPAVKRVYLDVTPKPPATIEYV
ncbi:MAG: hypothetical protein JW839_05675 [Candidatus Lokiarchaeota archaeon]|nr:hypothetical protein [Candidatus Lokiarchaeota archaeon]